MRSVVVTGVSSGIGWGTAKVLTRRGIRVFGSVRKQADAVRVQAELGDLFTPLVFDITDEAAVVEAAGQVREALKGGRLNGLVNNAGVSVPAPLAVQPVAEFRQQLEVNLTGPLIVTQAFLPQLGTDPALVGPAGRIVNVSSIGAQVSPPFLAAYAASKAGLEALSHSLRRELTPFGIEVLIVAPGSVATAIWDKAQPDIARWSGDPVYATPVQQLAAVMTRDGRAGYTPERLGEAIWTALSHPRPALRSSPGPESLFSRLALHLLPRRTLDHLITRQLGLTRV